MVGGAFEGMREIIERRAFSDSYSIGFKKTSLGETIEKDKNTVRHLLSPDDLMEYGFIPEFAGRVPVLVTLDTCLLYTSPSPRDGLLSRMPSSA